jgi:hypothetical protein
MPFCLERYRRIAFSIIDLLGSRSDVKLNKNFLESRRNLWNLKDCPAKTMQCVSCEKSTDTDNQTCRCWRQNQKVQGDGQVRELLELRDEFRTYIKSEFSDSSFFEDIGKVVAQIQR